MKNNKNIITYIIIAIIIALLVVIGYFLLKEKNDNKELVFNIKTSNMEIKIGESMPINYEISEDSNIVWESTNSSVATVNKGVVTGIGFGNTIIKGTATKDNETITRICNIITYIGDKDKLLNDILIPEGEMFITKGDSYIPEIEYDPINPYITSIEYSSLDENIAFFDGTIVANNTGTTDISITINGTITKLITVNVIDKQIEPSFSKKVTDIDIKNTEFNLKPGDTKKIEYEVIPNDGFVSDVKWESSNPEVVSVDDGIITAKSSGDAVVNLIVNNRISKEIKVMVSVPVTGITLKSSDKIVLKIGQSTKIDAIVNPLNATNKKISYTSSSGIVSINEGLVTGISAGKGTIVVETVDGAYKVEIPFVINPKSGIINGDGGVWGYSSKDDKTPVRADITFFKNLASKGKGTVSGNVYTYKDSSHSYTYNLSNSVLNTERRNIQMRIYYPQSVDLSMVNTFTFLGGSGELNLSGYIDHLDKNRNELKSSGIVILVSARGSYDAKDATLSTEFLKSIIDQKEGVHNAVGGYSMSGPAAGDAAGSSLYDRLIIFDSHFTANNSRIFNKEITIYSPVGDAMLKYTLNTLSGIKNYAYTNVTIVSNNGQIVNNYNSNYLVINPGGQMGRGHGYVNISNAKVFSYACR